MRCGAAKRMSRQNGKFQKKWQVSGEEDASGLFSIGHPGPDKKVAAIDYRSISRPS